jgi:hypothetical protein
MYGDGVEHCRVSNVDVQERAATLNFEGLSMEGGIWIWRQDMMLGTKGTFGFESKPSNCGMGVSSLVEDLVFFSGVNNKGIARGNLGMQTFFDHCVKTHLLWLGESYLGEAWAMGFFGVGTSFRFRGAQFVKNQIHHFSIHTPLASFYLFNVPAINCGEMNDYLPISNVSEFDTGETALAPSRVPSAFMFETTVDFSWLYSIVSQPVGLYVCQKSDSSMLHGFGKGGQSRPCLRYSSATLLARPASKLYFVADQELL